MSTLTTPDGRYIIVRGRLWRAANPNLDAATHALLVRQLMDARRAVKAANGTKDAGQLAAARAAVDVAKTALGERGPAWWSDGAKDFNRYLARNSPYAEWFATLQAGPDPSEDGT